MLATHKSPVEAKAVRVDNRDRDAQARLADKSFSDYMRAHNAQVARLAARRSAGV